MDLNTAWKVVEKACYGCYKLPAALAFVIIKRDKYLIRKTKKIDELEIAQSIVIDVLAGSNAWYNIRAKTDLSVERCKEIEMLYKRILKQYRERHNIWDREDDHEFL